MTKLLVIDTETTGTNPFLHSMLSFAAVVWTDGEIGETVEVLIADYGNTVLDPEAMAINGIDIGRHRQSGLTAEYAVATINGFISRNFDLDNEQQVSVAGHNVGFDIAFVKQLYNAVGANYDSLYSHRVLDTASVVTFLSLAGKLPLRGASSSSVFAYFGIGVPVGLRHTARGDAIATAQLLTRLLSLETSISANPAWGHFG